MTAALELARAHCSGLRAEDRAVTSGPGRRPRLGDADRDGYNCREALDSLIASTTLPPGSCATLLELWPSGWEEQGCGACDTAGARGKEWLQP